MERGQKRGEMNLKLKDLLKEDLRQTEARMFQYYKTEIWQQLTGDFELISVLTAKEKNHEFKQIKFLQDCIKQ